MWKLVRLVDLNVDLQFAFGSIGFRCDFNNNTLISFFRIGLGAHAAFLIQRNFCEADFVHINLHLQILWVGNGNQRRTRFAYTAETLRHDEWEEIGLWPLSKLFTKVTMTKFLTLLRTLFVPAIFRARPERRGRHEMLK